jgi:hypothetical protein
VPVRRSKSNQENSVYARSNLAPFRETTNITPTVSLTFQSYGSDRTGAVLLSPFLDPGTVSQTPFNHSSLLKSLEDIYDTDSYPGYAAAPGLVGFFGCVTSDIQTMGFDGDTP